MIACSLLTGCLTAGEEVRVTVDNTCRTRVVEASPELREWLKQQCTASGQCRPGVPNDLTRFIKRVVENNEVIRSLCNGSAPGSVVR